jgi:DNA-binding beta-propeller fold protein YncE
MPLLISSTSRILGGGEVVVFDTLQQKVVGVVKDVSSAHGVALAPEAGRLFVTATGSNELIAIDLKTLAVVGRAPAGDCPDGLDYAPALGKVYVTDEHGSGDTIFDGRSTHFLYLPLTDVGGRPVLRVMSP